MANKYQKGKIYKIWNDVDHEIYVGSTIETLSQRMAKHREKMKHKPHRKLYQHMFCLGADKFKIELLEMCPCECIEEGMCVLIANELCNFARLIHGIIYDLPNACASTLKQCV